MIYKQKLIKIGNSVGLTIPKTLRDSMNLSIGSEVYLRESEKVNEILISLEDKNETQSEVDKDFYNLVKTINKKYSKALKELANS